jgi:hypothetical protein
MDVSRLEQLSVVLHQNLWGSLRDVDRKHTCDNVHIWLNDSKAREGGMRR